MLPSGIGYDNSEGLDGWRFVARCENEKRHTVPFCVASVWRFRLQRRDGAQSGGRTHTPLREQDFESSASANSAIRAFCGAKQSNAPGEVHRKFRGGGVRARLSGLNFVPRGKAPALPRSHRRAVAHIGKPWVCARIPGKVVEKGLASEGRGPFLCALSKVRAVAQTGSALAWGARGREFKSHRPDHLETAAKCVAGVAHERPARCRWQS